MRLRRTDTYSYLCVVCVCRALGREASSSKLVAQIRASICEHACAQSARGMRRRNANATGVLISRFCSHVCVSVTFCAQAVRVVAGERRESHAAAGGAGGRAAAAAAAAAAACARPALGGGREQLAVWRQVDARAAAVPERAARLRGARLRVFPALPRSPGRLRTHTLNATRQVNSRPLIDLALSPLLSSAPAFCALCVT